MEIRSDGLEVYLKSPVTDDASEITRRADDYDIAYNIARWGSFPHPYTISDALSFIENAAKFQREGLEFHTAIRLVEDDMLIGMIGLKQIDLKDKKAEIGYWIGKQFWGKGYGTQAASLMSGYGFGVLNLNRIYAKTFDFNRGSLRVLEKVGFVREGILKQDTYHKDRYVDEVLLGLLSKDFKHNLKLVIK